MKRISVLGSTGSIGRATLAVVESFPEHFDVVALAAGGNIESLSEQIRRHNPSAVSVGRSECAQKLAAEFPGLDVFWGSDGLEMIAGHPDAEMVVVAVVGAIGFVPTMAAIRAGKNIALANKETLVAGGELVMRAAAARGIHLLPIDSEHSALHHLLQNQVIDGVTRLILTASGGPFRTWSVEEMETATIAEALDHPNWKMGDKISIDSATMMNKGFEIIEAHHLFGVPEDRIEVVIHPQSLVHAMVETVDHSITAHMSAPDMRHSIASALAWPDRLTGPVPALDLSEIPALSFAQPDPARFPALNLARSAVRAGGEMPAVLNAANEVAVTAFLEGRCTLPAVTSIVADTLDAWVARNRPLASIDQVLAADLDARKHAAANIMKYGAPVPGSEIRC